MKKYFLSLIALCIGSVPLFSQGKLTPELMWKMGRAGDVHLSPDGKKVVYGVTRYDLDKNKGNTDIYLVPVSMGEAVQLTATDKSEFNLSWSSDGKKIFFLYSEKDTVQVWEMNVDGSGRNQVSFIQGGVRSYSFSPDGKNMLYTQDVKLERGTKDIYPDLPLSNAYIYDDMMYRHWDSWHDYTYRHIFYSPVASGKVTAGMDIMPGELWDAPLAPFFNPAEITWSPDGKIIAYTSKKLKGKEYTLSTNSDIYLYNIESGKTENITDGMPGYDREPVFSHDGKKIAWQSMKTPGYESDKERLYVMDLATKAKEDLTAALDNPATHYEWSMDNKKIYFICGIKATYQVYSVEVATKKISPVTHGKHDYLSVQVHGSVIVGHKMSMSMSPEIFRIDETSARDMQLTFTNKSIYESVILGDVEERWIKTTDNKDMLVWVIYPPGFDRTKKYPALLYCQGGPQNAVSQFFSYRWNFQLMAANGYVVIAPNRRGLPTFGSEWNDQIRGDYGGQNMRDLLTAVDVISKEPFIDANRLGAVGASYGGFTVYWLAGHHEKRFKAFIAHCGMFNFESKFGSTEEYFFPMYDLEGAYWQKPRPKAYNDSPHLSVDKWDTPILIIEGEKDYRIPYSEGIQAFNMARLVGVPARYLHFPDEGHQVMKPQNSILWNRVFFEWLDKWLK